LDIVSTSRVTDRTANGKEKEKETSDHNITGIKTLQILIL